MCASGCGIERRLCAAWQGQRLWVSGFVGFDLRMMVVIRKVLFCTYAIFAFCNSQIAYADWQYTRCGMSPSDVYKNSNGKSPQSYGDSSIKIDGYDIGNVGKYYAAGREFNAVFYYKNGGLSMVEISLNSDDGCRFISNDLMSLYGKPISQINNNILNSYVWHDQGKNNKVVGMVIGKSCYVRYTPLRSPDNEGL